MNATPLHLLGTTLGQHYRRGSASLLLSRYVHRVNSYTLSYCEACWHIGIEHLSCTCLIILLTITDMRPGLDACGVLHQQSILPPNMQAFSLTVLMQ